MIEIQCNKLNTEKESFDFGNFFPWNLDKLQGKNKAPEVNCGFEVHVGCATNKIFEILHDENGVYAKYSGNGDVPLSYTCKAEEGNYRVSIQLYSSESVDVQVFLGRRCLIYQGKIKAGEYKTIEGVQNISPFIPRYFVEPTSNHTINVTVLGKNVHICQIQYEKVEVPTIYIAGDSTVTDQCGSYPYFPEQNYGGWGQMLSAFLGTKYAVSNQSHSGLTTKSFREDGHYNILYQRIKKDDIFLIQFGHNDQKLEELDANQGYRKNMLAYIREIKKKGAKPIIITPLARNSWKQETYNDLLDEYAKVCFSIAESEEISLIDLHEYSMRMILEEGKEKAKKWFFPSDYTHTNDYGAYLCASFIASSLFHQVETNRFQNWVPPVNPRKIEIPSDIANQSANQEEVIFRDIERGNERLRRHEALDMVVKTCKYFPINVYNDLYIDIIGNEVYAGTVQCAYQNGILLENTQPNEKLKPNDFIDGYEFYEYLLRGYRGRVDGNLEIDYKLKKFVEKGYEITRLQAAKICNTIKI